jgi:hypothetical protein
MITKDAELISEKKGDWIINIGCVRKNNGLNNQSFLKEVQANLHIVKRIIDNKEFIADGRAYRIKKSNRWVYLTHLWINSNFNEVWYAGYYSKVKNPYNDDVMRKNYFSTSVCTLNDLI